MNQIRIHCPDHLLIIVHLAEQTSREPMSTSYNVSTTQKKCCDSSYIMYYKERIRLENMGMLLFLWLINFKKVTSQKASSHFVRGQAALLNRIIIGHEEEAFVQACHYFASRTQGEGLQTVDCKKGSILSDASLAVI